MGRDGSVLELVAQASHRDDVLRLGRSEMLSGGRRKEALLADAMEAVIAAVAIDNSDDTRIGFVFGDVSAPLFAD